MYININCQIIIIIDWGDVSNMCGARCLIGRGEAFKGARCQLGRDVWFPKKLHVVTPVIVPVGL